MSKIYKPLYISHQKVTPTGVRFPMIYELVPHAQTRAQQRGLSKGDIEFILEHGEVVFRQGFRFVHVNRSILKHCRNKQLISKLQNAIVVLKTETEVVVTCYKNSEALKRIRKKSKYLKRGHVA